MTMRTQDCEFLSRTENILRVKFRDQFTPRDWLAQDGQGNGTAVIPMRGKLGEAPDTGSKLATYCGEPSPGEAVVMTFLAENWNRRTVGEATCGMVGGG